MTTSVKKILESAIENELFPGVQYAIIKQQSIKTNAIGFKRLFPEKEKITGNEIYDVASLTKVIVTTTLIMQLIEKNIIELKTPLAHILKTFKHQHITIEDLLLHQSGLPADIPNASKLASKDEVIDYILDVDLNYETATHIVYSDIGFMLLGLAIEKLYDKPLSACAQTYIFEPLGMKNSSFHPPKSRCAPTEYRNDLVYQGFLQGDVHDEKAFAMQGESGHAGLFSTAYDIGLFIKAILNNTFVLKDKTIDMLFIAAAKKTNLNGVNLIRSLGWDKPQPGGSSGDYSDFKETILHTGFTGCNMWIDRRNKLGFVLLSNDVHPTRDQKGILPLRHMIANQIYIEEVKHET